MGDIPERPPANRIETLTALRGIAAWWVVAFHYKQHLAEPFAGISTLFDKGYLAVDLFFILSGFVIMLNYADRFRSLSFPNVLDFIVARIARIYPLHIFMCVLFVINPIAIVLFSSAGVISERYSAYSFILNILLMQTWGLIDYLSWNVPAWSISVEWLAYLVAPLIIALSLHLSRTTLLAILSALSVTIFIALSFAALGASSLGSDIPQLGSLRCVLEFTLGVTICKIYLGKLNINSYYSSLSILLALCLMLVLFTTGIPDFAIAPTAFALLLLGVCNPPRMLSRLLLLRPLLFLGIMSYSTYMVHYFVLDWVKFLLVDKAGSHWLEATIAYFTTTLFLSLLLYRFVELPGRRFVRRRYGFRSRDSSRDRSPEEAVQHGDAEGTSNRLPLPRHHTPPHLT